MQVGRQRNEPFQYPHCSIPFDVDLFLFFSLDRHPYCSNKQKRAKDIHYPVKACEKGCPCNYQRNPHCYCAYNPYREHLVLQLKRDSKGREKIMINTNMLSILSDFSSAYPVTNSRK